MEDSGNAEVRQAAGLALEAFVARRPEFDAQVFEQLQAKLNFSERQADETMTLLHGFDEAARNNSATYDLLFVLLRSDSIGQRELASWRLGQIDPDGALRARYHAGDPEPQRERAIGEWRKRIPEGKLPPGRAQP
jgi:hypothetical protein